MLKTGYPHGQTIVVLKPLSQYDVLRVFCDDIAHGFEQLGCKAVVIDSARDDWGKQLFDGINAGDIRFVFDFNGGASGIKHGEVALFDAAKTPFVSLFADSPLYHEDRLKAWIHHWLILFTNETAMATYRKGFSGRNHTLNGLAYLGGRRQVTEPLKRLRDRKYGIAFMGSYYGKMAMVTQIETDSGFMGGLLRDTLVEALHDGTRTPLEVVASQLSRRGIDPEHMVPRGMFTVARYVEHKIRVYRRAKAITAFKKLPVYLFGDESWKGLEGLGSNVQIMGTRPFSEAGEVFAETKIGLSMMPASSGGLHERMLYGMHHGSVGLTDRLAHIPPEFKDNENVLFFDWNDLDHLEERVTDLLHNEDKLEEISERGRALVQDRYSWKDTAKAVLAHAERHHYWLSMQARQ